MVISSSPVISLFARKFYSVTSWANWPWAGDTVFPMTPYLPSEQMFARSNPEGSALQKLLRTWERDSRPAITVTAFCAPRPASSRKRRPRRPAQEERIRPLRKNRDPVVPFPRSAPAELYLPLQPVRSMSMTRSKKLNDSSRKTSELLNNKNCVINGRIFRELRERRPERGFLQKLAGPVRPIGVTPRSAEYS
ncbi:hypothetical protein MTP99_016377 [Tenebrio molitor]|jgi:hypothetical protein|nr:hypothetical protein MTP99_016377 [Tenebrio molitor]